MGSNVLDKRGGLAEALASVGAEVMGRSFFEECEAERRAEAELRKLERRSQRFFTTKGAKGTKGKKKGGMRAQTRLTREQQLALNGFRKD